MNPPTKAIAHEFRRHHDLATRALAWVDDRSFFERPAHGANPLAVLVKHLAGNLTYRWTNFPHLDESERNRDAEFILTEADTREVLEQAWNRGWKAVFDAFDRVRDADLNRIVVIQNEPHTVLQAMLRGMTHAVYHTGQIVLLVRVLRPESPWLTIAPGQSLQRTGHYLRHPTTERSA